MTYQELQAAIARKRSFLCVGLDTELRKLPLSLSASRDGVYRFNCAIVDATAELAIAFKPNLAFYEVQGVQGWQDLARTVDYIKKHYPDVLTIADGKRGDISNTATMYAQSMFSSMGFDAVTVAPYMGRDAVQPFLEYQDKWAILLAVTSNESGQEFQMLPMTDGKTVLFERVLQISRHWGHEGNMMYVVGATHPQLLQRVRAIIPHHFLLVPGVGQQGGDLEEVIRYGMSDNCGLIVNSSRGIIYASNGIDYAQAAHQKALGMQQIMAQALDACGIGRV